MFGRRIEEKRSLEEMFKQSDDMFESADEELVSDDFEKNKEQLDEGTTEKNSCVPINPLSCFGMEEGKTEKWLDKCVKFWFCLMSFMWFLFGALTFAPVIFISNKVNVVFKDKKKSLLCATLIHGLILCLIVIFVFIK